MDDWVPFKEAGDIKLTVPLAQEFERILADFLRVTVSKSGFDGEDSSRIAQQISSRVFEKLAQGREHANHQEIEVSMAHRPGQITIKTAIPGLGYNEQEEFKSR